MIKKNNNLVDYGKEDVEFIARESLYKGFFSLDLYPVSYTHLRAHETLQSI